jgi:hypothetical protein
MCEIPRPPSIVIKNYLRGENSEGHSLVLLKVKAGISQMADDVHDVWRREFEDLGEEQVHARLGRHIWGEDKERLARQWLGLRETSLAREANDLAKKANDAAKEANDLAHRNNIIAALALVVAVIALVVSLFLRRG